MKHLFFAAWILVFFAHPLKAKEKKIKQSLPASSYPRGGAPGQIGLGVILGSPTGFTLKAKHQNNNFFDLALAYSLRSDETIHIHGDYLWQFPNRFEIDNVPMFTYVGVGARLKHFDHHKKGDDFALGVRLPAGFGYFIPQSHVELFAEAALIMDVLESTDLDINIGLGGRFWF
jgi:hypothetical protein